MQQIEKKSSEIIASAQRLGLNEADIKCASDFLANREYGLCFDHVITQMFEYDVAIQQDFLLLTSNIAKMLEIPEEHFSFMAELLG